MKQYFTFLKKYSEIDFLDNNLVFGTYYIFINSIILYLSMQDMSLPDLVPHFPILFPLYRMSFICMRLISLEHCYGGRPLFISVCVRRLKEHSNWRQVNLFKMYTTKVSITTSAPLQTA